MFLCCRNRCLEINAKSVSFYKTQTEILGAFVCKPKINKSLESVVTVFIVFLHGFSVICGK